jgi:hypothetical protein
MHVEAAQAVVHAQDHVRMGASYHVAHDPCVVKQCRNACLHLQRFGMQLLDS